jgi:hypothetical protein
MTVSLDMSKLLTEMADNHRITIDDLISRAIVGMALIRLARQRGLKHVGFVSNPRQLDAELHGLLPEQPHLEIFQGTSA